jgi:hypothetical protein
MLQPDFAVADIDLEEDVIHAPFAFPTNLPQLIVPSVSSQTNSVRMVSSEGVMAASSWRRRFTMARY